MTFRLRKATEADKSAIGQIVDATNMFPSSMLDDMMAPYLSGSLGELWTVIGDPATAVAYAVLERLTNGTWNQLLIAVRPDVQRSGLGRSLMQHLEDAVGANEGRMVIVETSSEPEFEGARAFYRSIGYTEEGRIRDFYDRGNDKVVFRRVVW